MSIVAVGQGVTITIGVLERSEEQGGERGEERGEMVGSKVEVREMSRTDRRVNGRPGSTGISGGDGEYGRGWSYQRVRLHTMD